MTQQQADRALLLLIFLRDCITDENYEWTLQAIEQINQLERSIFTASIKEFELLLEQCGNILRKALKAYGGSSKKIDELFYKDVFRLSAKHGLVDVELVQRWFTYRDNRNNTTHDYGEHFVQETLSLLPHFMQDAKDIIQTIEERFKEDH